MSSLPSGSREERHVADARVEGLARELDALRLELAPRLLDVGDAQRDRARVRARELRPMFVGSIR